jgi:hypothetical protein
MVAEPVGVFGMTASSFLMSSGDRPSGWLDTVFGRSMASQGLAAISPKRMRNF